MFGTPYEKSQYKSRDTQKEPSVNDVYKEHLSNHLVVSLPFNLVTLVRGNNESKKDTPEPDKEKTIKVDQSVGHEP